jgi:hypothetical protein
VNRAIAVLGAVLTLSACTALTLAERESPACAGLSLGSTIEGDAQFIAQASVELPAGQLAATLDAFIAAKGLEQFQCAEQMAEALLGSPVAPIDAGAPVLDAGPPTALQAALMLNHAAIPGALEKLQTYKATRLIGGAK